MDDQMTVIWFIGVIFIVIMLFVSFLLDEPVVIAIEFVILIAYMGLGLFDKF